MSFKRAFFTVGGFTLLSRFVGFIRDVCAANILGAGMAADAFFVALRLPNLFRRLFAEGAFTISFVPLFTTELKEDEQKARSFAQEALAILVSTLLVFTLLMMIFMPWVMHVITPGYADDAEKFNFAVELSQITFPYLFLISIAALLGSILNALGRFGPYAASPIAFNLVQIAALIIWNDNEMTAARAQAWAVTLSGVVQLLWLMVSMRRAGWHLKLRRPQLTPRIRKLLKLVGPGALGAGVIQVNIFIDMVLASKLPEGAISYLSYADRLFQLPVGVIGIAIGTALLPTLSRTLRDQPGAHALHDQNRAVEFGLYLGLPAAVALGVIPGPILAVLYERGAFTPEVTHFVAYALAAYALSIPAYMVSKVLTVAFYAREDTRSPFIIATRTVVVNTTFSIIVLFALMHSGHENIAHAGLALSTAVTAWLNVYLLTRRLKALGHYKADRQLWRNIGGMLLSAAVMGLLLFIGHALLASWFSGSLFVRASALALLGSVGASSYLLLAHLTGAQRLNDVFKMLKRRPPKGAPPPSVSE